MAIPKIIHQVWEGRTEPKMPTRLQILARTWQEQNPNWEYHLWSGREMDELVATHFPEYLSMYQNFPYNVQRWDTIRYMMLYVYGGIYTDLDTECFQPISPILENVTIGFGEEPPIHTKPIRIGNAFLVSEKENSAWQTILNEILRNMVEKESAIETVMHSTGPNMINRLFDRLKKENGAYGFPYSQVTPVSKYDMYRYIFQGEKEVFLEKIKHAYCAHYFFGSWDTELTFY
ncbi:glycosyltransferase family 32 protein [Parabacteroides distasonis]|uniref:glycosyltransferase family 32 protein n=1 Tax=Parabacteroides distasonis TaxID=823 RepID=UPI003F7481CF